MLAALKPVTQHLAALKPVTLRVQAAVWPLTRTGRHKFREVLREEFRTLHPKVPLDENVSMAELYEKIGALEDPQAALCLSGGGIRSASFALGAIQALSRNELLGKFHYLSTVSGGGYTGGWLSAWRLHQKNDEDVFAALKAPSPLRPEEPEEIKSLRSYSNFLTPKKGLTSADTWAGMALYIRNLFLNWIVLGPLLLALLSIPIVASNFVRWARNWPVDAKNFIFGLASLFLFIALTASVANRPGAGKSGIGQNGYLGLVLLPIVIAAALFALYGAQYGMAVEAQAATNDVIAYVAGWALWGAILYFVAWIVAFAIRQRLRLGRLGLIGTPGDPVPPLHLLIYWTVSGALAGAVMGYASHIWASLAGGYGFFGERVSPDGAINLLVVFGISGIMIAILTAELLYVGLSSYAREGDADREWLARSSGWVVAASLAWLFFSLIGLYGAVLVRGFVNWELRVAVPALGGLSGLTTLILGNSRNSPATPEQPAARAFFSTATILNLATFIFLICLAIGGTIILRLLLERLGPPDSDQTTAYLRLITAAVTAATLFAFTFVASYFVNVNRFSLHAIYRNRLIRAFLGSARTSNDKGTLLAPDPFTGFDPNDNFPMAMLNNQDAGIGRDRLFHVVNTTLNVVSGKNLAWQERKAESFVMTPQACGNDIVNFRLTSEFGGRGSGLSLGTAVAVSGAAASPNMGYHSSPLVSIVMTLFNVRLGWWFGNPADDSTYRREGPRTALLPIVRELFGLTNDAAPYVYLSDGGHFENLGIYEMARRRCRFILAFDAGADLNCALEDLGNAMRKIRIDLSTRIEFKELKVVARAKATNKSVYAAIGSINYPEGGEGTIIYVKAGYHGVGPADVRSYAALHPDFPHESTLDQWFTESQMESYRALGDFIVREIGGGDQTTTFASFAEFAEKVRAYTGTPTLK
jgi:hypothetical protein